MSKINTAFLAIGSLLFSILCLPQFAHSQDCATFTQQNWVVLPTATRNLSVIDGKLYCYSGGLLLSASVSSGSIVSLVGDTAHVPLDEKMDYVVKNPATGNIFYTRSDSHGFHTCYEVIPREGKKPKTEKVKINNKYTINHPVFSDDGRIMVFSSNPSSRNGFDLYYIVKKNSGEWSDPRSLGNKINTPGDECAPTFYENILCFSSRDNTPNAPWILKAVKLYQTNPLNGKNEIEFNEALDLPAPFNAMANNIEIAFDTLTNRTYLLSDRDGRQSLYLFESEMPLTVVSGRINSPDGSRMPVADVYLFSQDKLICHGNSDKDGYYRFLLSQKKDYTLWVSSPGYFGNSVNIESPSSENKKMFLEQQFDISLDRLELNSKSFIYDVFGPDASIELSKQGKQKLTRIVRFLYENQHIKLDMGVTSSVSENVEHNKIVNERRIETLRQYLSQMLTQNVINIYDSGDNAVNRVRNAFNSCLTVRLEATSLNFYQQKIE